MIKLFKKNSKKYIAQYVEKRLSQIFIREIEKIKGPRYSDILYKELYPANLMYLEDYIKKYKVFRFRYFFLFDDILICLYCYVVSNPLLHNYRENYYLGRNYKGEKMYLMDAVSSTYVDIFEMHTYVL
jgi:hypothetical protein